ncbi:MAG: omptin family outer membrane protease [Spirochaetes bacterium]|nr:omptin family outer membrane protease [Spirochaetota bacterium]
MKIYRILLILLCIIYCADSALGNTSLSDSLNLVTEIGTGILHGTVGEYVYYNNRTLSQLNWNINYLWYHTLSIALNYNFFFIKIQLQNGINTGTIGTIDDSDWVDDNNPTIKTHYSKHDNYCERYNSYNGNVGFDTDINTIIHFKAYAGFLYRTIKMSARDGYIQYPPGSPKVPVYGVGILYEQLYYIPYLGLTSDINITEKIKISAGLMFSLFAFAEDEDNHVHRNPGDDINFYADYDGIIYLNAHAGCQYIVNETIAISLNMFYEYVPEQKGDTYYINTSTGIKSPLLKNAAGLKYSVYSVQISLVYNLKL